LIALIINAHPTLGVGLPQTSGLQKVEH